MTYKVDYAEILETAIEKPGIISQAYSQFHNYSLNNTMLVAVQCYIRGTDFGPIANYRKWQELGRQVQAGEKGFYIVHPVIIPVEEEVEQDNGEVETVKRQKLVGFSPKKTAFVLAQTDGDPVDFEATIGDFDFGRLWAEFKLELTDEFDAPNGSVMGYTDGLKIAINPLNPHPQKTMIHELAHYLMGHTTASKDRRNVTKTLSEVEAEGVAYIVSTVLDMGGQDESREYIQYWLADNAIPEKSAQLIISTADTILKIGTDKNSD